MYLAGSILRARGLNFYIVIKKEMLKTSSSQESLPECIDIGHGTSLGQGDSSLFK